MGYGKTAYGSKSKMKDSKKKKVAKKMTKKRKA
jgi:hypothetical protein